MSEWVPDPKNTTPDERVIYNLWHDLKFCGCSSPEGVMEMFRYELRSLDDHDWNFGRNAYELLPLYVLDSAGLTEHGGSIEGSWLTKKGKEVLEVLERSDLFAFVDRWGEIGLVPPDA